jgi:lipoprotein-anchoring transpeptidase ErfK/SrfK
MQWRRRHGGATISRMAFAAVLFVAALSLEAPSATAQDFFPFFYDDEPRRPPPRAKRRPRAVPQSSRTDSDRGGPKTKAARSAGADKPSGGGNLARPLFAIVSIADQRISIYNDQGLVARSAVSTGKADHPTPKGIFTIIGRERYHLSNLYSDAPMPFMQRITWSGVALHLGVVPGYPASHGCIRLPAGFATKLWGLTRIGERVVISSRDVTPVEIDHPSLPAPKMRPQTETEPPKPAADAPEAAAVVQPPAPLNPHQYAAQIKAKADAAAAAAAQVVKEAAATVDAKRQESVRAAAALKMAQDDYRKAEEALNADEGSAADPIDVLEKDATNPSAPLAEAAARLDSAKTRSAAMQAELEDAIRRFNDAKAAADAAASAVKEASRRLMPLSVLISKKDQRIYVRQGLAHLFDAPISVRDPETPLGSHLYIATATKDDGSSLKWSVVSPPARIVQAQSDMRRTNRTGVEDAEEAFSAPREWGSTAEEALERIELTQDVRDRIAERLWTGGSLIISDRPLSGETSGEGTDLTIKLD